MKLDRKKFFKNVYFLFVLLIAAYLLVGSRLNYNKKESLGWFNSDEYYTVTHTLRSIHLGHKYFDTRIFYGFPETSSWLARFSYPFALIHMNRNLGYNWNLGTNFWPGHNYIKRNWIEPNLSYPNLSDPNQKEFLIGLRTIYVLLIFLSFLPLLYYCYLKEYYLCGLALISIPSLSYLLLHQQSSFYVEPSMIIFLNILIAFLLFIIDRKGLSSEMGIWGGIICALALSSKVSTAFFLLLPFVYYYFLESDKKVLWKVTKWHVFSWVAGFCVINYFAFLSSASMNNYLHGLTAIFWWYSGGTQDLDEIGSNWSHLREILRQFRILFGPVYFLIPYIVILGFLNKDKKSRLVIASFAVTVAITVFSLSKQGSFINRNLMPYFVPTIFLVFYSLERGFIYLKSRNVKYLKVAYVISGLIIFFSPFKWTPRLKYGETGETYIGAFYNPHKDFLQTAKELIANEKWSDVVVIGYTADDLKSIPGAESFVYRESAPKLILSKNFDEHVANLKSELLKTDEDNPLVLVKRTKANKQLTNWILQHFFPRNHAFGNDFIFHKFIKGKPKPRYYLGFKDPTESPEYYR